MAGGTVTRKDLIEDQGLEFGIVYAENIRQAIKANQELIESAKALNAIAGQYSKASGNQQFIELKQQEILLSTKALNAVKLETEALKSAEKIKQETLRTKKLELDAIGKEEAAKKRTTQLTIEERVQNEVNNKILKESARERLGLTSVYDKLNKSRTEAKNKLRDLIASETASTESVKKAREEFEKLDGKVKLADAAVGDFTKNVGNYPKLNAFTGGLKNLVGAFGLIGGVAAFASVIKSAANTVVEYQKEIVNLGAIAGKTRKEIAPLEAQIRAVAAGSLNSATEVAKLATELIKLGSTPEEAAKLLKPINDLSIALRASAEDSATLVKSLLNTFGAGAEEATKYTDVLAAAANYTALGFEELRDSMSYIAPVANAMGYSIEKTAAMVGVLADNGIKAESAGRLLRTMMGNAAKAGVTLEVQLEKVVNSTDKVKTATQLFGSEGASLGIILANNKDRVAELTKEFENSKGSLKELTDKQLQSLDSKLKILNSTWEEFVLSVEDGQGSISTFFSFFVDGAADALSSLIRLNTSWDSLYEKAKTEGSASGKEKFDTKFMGIFTPGISDEQEVAQQIKDAAEGLKAVYYNELFKIEQEIAERGEARGINFLGLPAGRKLNEEKERLTKLYEEQRAIIGSANEKILGTKEAAVQKEKELDEAQIEENKKIQAAKEKARKEHLARMKKIDDDSFALNKFRLEQGAEISKEISENESESIEDRIDAYLNAQQIEIALAQETAAYKLRAISKYDDGVRDLTSKEIQTLIAGGEIKKELYDNLSKSEILIIEELQAKRNQIEKNDIENRQKIADSIVEIEKSKFAKIAQDQDTELNKQLLRQNQDFQDTLDALKGNQLAIEDATKEHEARVLEIKKEALEKGLTAEINATKTLLENADLSAEVKSGLLNKLSKLELELNQVSVNDSIETNDSKLDLEKEYSERVKELRSELASVLTDFASTLFDNRIAKIDAELQANDEYYARQIELAGNDAAQKDLLEKEREKKREAIEKKKKKAEYQAALFNKIVTLAMIANQTAMASIAALAPPPIGLGPVLGGSLLPYIISLGALQAGVVAATPLPKYEKGTDNHPGGFAEVGEKRPEVIKEPGRNPYIVSKPTILDLPKGTQVIPSLKEYEALERASILASLDNQVNKMSAYNSGSNFNNRLDTELLEELKKNTRATERSKSNVNIQNNIDIGHEIWKFSNVKWTN